MQVGVRDLKRHLSAYLDRAARGEVIEVTRHGRPRVQIGPLPMAARVEEGIREGWLHPGDGSPPAARRQVFRGRARVEDVLDSDRGE
jgi:prevent-host-death family protein